MAAAAVLRRLAGRALRRPSSSFPHVLLGRQQQQQQPQLVLRSPPVEHMTPRRLYSSDGVVIKAEVNKVRSRSISSSLMLCCVALIHAPGLFYLYMIFRMFALISQQMTV